MLKRLATYLAVFSALGAGFLVGKATDTVFSGDGRLASDRSDVVDLDAPASTAVPTTPATTPRTDPPPLDTTPPEVIIVNPVDGERVNERTYRFEGFTEPGAGVRVGSYAAGVGTDGEWSIVLKLTPGTNRVTAIATDAAGNESVATVTVVYDAPAPPPKEERPACAETTGDPCKPACPSSSASSSSGGRCEHACTQTTGDPCKPACTETVGGDCQPASCTSSGGECKPACAQNENWCEPACAQNEGPCDKPPSSTPVEVPVEAPAVE